jgi:hypothetical protein
MDEGAIARCETSPSSVTVEAVVERLVPSKHGAENVERRLPCRFAGPAGGGR